jgi:hypothetical protein
MELAVALIVLVVGLALEQSRTEDVRLPIDRDR